MGLGWALGRRAEKFRSVLAKEILSEVVGMDDKQGLTLAPSMGDQWKLKTPISVSLWQLLPYPQLWGRSTPAGQLEGVGAGVGPCPPSIPSPLSLPHPRPPPTAQIPALKAATRLSACRA